MFWIKNNLFHSRLIGGCVKGQYIPDSSNFVGVGNSLSDPL